MLQNLIADAKGEFIEDYKNQDNVNELANIYEQGMKKAIALLMEQSLYGPIKFDLVQE